MLSTELTLSLEERLLFSMARNPNLAEIGSTAHYNIENCLDFPRKMFPDFDLLVRGKTVLDHGCGYGWQSVALRRHCAAARVFGLDVVNAHLDHGRRLARRHEVADAVEFGPAAPPDLRGQFDVVLSLSAFEHYSDPAGELERMRRQLKPGGIIVLAFAEPWWSPYGSHFQGYARLPGTTRPFPWLNLLFSDRALLSLRARFRDDHPQRIEEVEGGLNRMTVRRFERIVRGGDFHIERISLYSVKRLPLVTRIPLVREFLTNAAACILRSEAHRPAHTAAA